MKKRLFSGIQPSGELHIGNYIGAIAQWLELQREYESVLCIVDLHAITVRQDPTELRNRIRQLAAWYLACGIDPKSSTLFVQSEVSAHAELAWILNTFTQMGELSRMTQFKDKSKQHESNINVGLFAYPVLMAADILLYDTAIVPVGEDQKQHIELTRDIAQRFNAVHEQSIFTVPEPMIQTQGARIMGLDHPEKKMSKSSGSEWNYILLSDTPDLIRKKIKRAVTDSGSEVRLGEDKQAITNLLTLFSVCAGTPVDTLVKVYAGKGYGEFKTDCAEAIVSWIQPLQKKHAEYMHDAGELDAILDDGATRARGLAQEKLAEVYRAMGLQRIQR